VRRADDPHRVPPQRGDRITWRGHPSGPAPCPPPGTGLPHRDPPTARLPGDPTSLGFTRRMPDRTRVPNIPQASNAKGADGVSLGKPETRLTVRRRTNLTPAGGPDRTSAYGLRNPVWIPISLPHRHFAVKAVRAESRAACPASNHYATETGRRGSSDEETDESTVTENGDSAVATSSNIRTPSLILFLP
jgi:hypothetical protein